LKKFSWAAIAFEQDFYIGRAREIQEDGEKLDMEFVQKWDGRYRWPTRKDEAVVDKRFVLSLVEMRASGKHFELHQLTEEDLAKNLKSTTKNCLLSLRKAIWLIASMSRRFPHQNQ
jgi:hypothetical protein